LGVSSSAEVNSSSLKPGGVSGGGASFSGSSKRFSFVQVDHSDLRIFDRKCYATFAGEGEMVVLLKDT
jgi:hypothetical protein